MMKFEDISFYVTIGIAIINITGALRKVAKIKKEEPLYKVCDHLRQWGVMLWTMIIPLTFNKINVFLWK